MKRGQKIDMLIAALARVIAEGRDDKEGYKSAPRITFLSENEVWIDGFPGERLPVNKVFENNPLAGLLKEVFEYYFDDERKYYMECLYEEDEEAYEDFEDRGVYNPDGLPGHIYHALRLFGEFINEI